MVCNMLQLAYILKMCITFRTDLEWKKNYKKYYFILWLFFFQFELLFCLQDESDPALMVVKALMEKYPKVDAKIFIGKLLGPNR